MKYPAMLKPISRFLRSRTVSAVKFVKNEFLTFAETRTFATGFYLCLTMIIITIAVVNTKIVQVDNGGATKLVYTFRNNPASILNQCGIKLNSYDEYKFSGFNGNTATLKVTYAFPVKISADKRQQVVYVTKGTVADVLKKAGISIDNDDIISGSIPQSTLTAKAENIVPVSENKTNGLSDDSSQIQDQAGDSDNVKLDTCVQKGMQITIQRVRMETVYINKSLEFKTVKQPSSLFKQGTSSVQTPGKNGQSVITMQNRYIDGQLAEQKIVSEKVVKKPVDEKVLVGEASGTPVSKMEPSNGLLLTSRGTPVRYSKCMNGVATAYTARKGAGTASGRKAMVGHVAIDPRVIPYGTRLYITSSDGSFVYGYAIAADTGTFATNGSGVDVDLYFATMKECLRFGERNVKIYVLK